MKKLYKAPALKSIEFEVSDTVLQAISMKGGSGAPEADEGQGMDTREFIDWDED